MKNIWVQLIWITIVTIESFLYSICKYYLTGEDCAPQHVSNSANSFIELFDRFCEYQSWFIPLIWLYWPTKTHK